MTKERFNMLVGSIGAFDLGIIWLDKIT